MTDEEQTPVERQIVLCFDGTGNTFRTDGTETNILRICRMLERTDEQCMSPSTGIGTQITPGSLASTTIRRTGRLAGSSHAVDLALGRTFHQHVLGGYRFLMRHYRASTQIYVFGFSRGAFTARFLVEMVDFVGLLGPDNEEMLPLIWKAFMTWKTRGCDAEAKRRALHFVTETRETLCRPTSQPVRFLGVFDTVNSIADFRVDLQIISMAQVTRHAVSVDERRVKFRPVLLKPMGTRCPCAGPLGGLGPERTASSLLAAWKRKSRGDAAERLNTAVLGSAEEQDVQEVWFPGGHADIGGGCQRSDEREKHQLSHAPLVWMVQEASRAGLRFDKAKLRRFGCAEVAVGDDGGGGGGRQGVDESVEFHTALEESSTRGTLHDLLSFGHGLSRASVLAWRAMEYFPVRRIDLLPQGRWKVARWPPPRGAARGVPDDAMIHVSVIRRMKADPGYRPQNLLGRRDDCTGSFDATEWQIHASKGDAVRETWTKMH
ncbi:hypothetical protein P168DRAFT_313611 [Aspergillus campestris IBT 28561]|uniref:T6SS Phospholipase effector Tle1-like catalytic domain-containing protein n=1 Tax=Aspergillus campestris (strain IBT 28561) TaxID=1392248 RepID=A0A2I1CR95_ASPC2|nr:uncharacterized protein P168DRAFT_313611 [Aspergillus campestris IBT 28561]PKY00138.1 hypothetical protein P168DRAFT_313611 [Aspergillus campestris IBT 28561]